MTTSTRADVERVPWSIWLIAAGVFTMITSELMVGGLLRSISGDLGISLGAATMLISGFAAGQVFGPWVLGVPLSRFRPRSVMGSLLVGFSLAQLIGLLAGWPTMLGMRFVIGAFMSAYFTIAIGATVTMVPEAVSTRAIAVIFNGATIGTTLGLPLATLAGRLMDWRSAFVIDSALVLVVAVLLRWGFPAVEGTPAAPIRRMLRPLSNRRVWPTFATAAATIGATLLAFSFFATILEKVTEVPGDLVPWLLALFGLANVVGMTVVGRVASRAPTRVVASGLIVLNGGLLLFWAGAASAALAITALVIIGVSGTSLNPALTERTIRAGGTDPAIMAMMPTIVTGGILFGTAVGGLIVGPLGLRGPLWVGAVLAGLGLLTLLPDVRTARTRSTLSEAVVDGPELAVAQCPL